jgi:hypothetical protein
MGDFTFFTSYAHRDHDPSLLRFVKKLREEVGPALTPPKDPLEAGFFDEEDIQAADEWEKRLGSALASADVIVSLFSPSYSASRYCGKEYQVFIDRRDQWLAQPGNGDKRARVVFTLLWRIPTGPLPELVKKFQFTDKELPEDYEKKGLHYVAKLGKQRFLKAVIALAESIRDSLVEGRLPPAAQPPVFAETPSAFHHARYGYSLLALPPEGSGWAPYPKGGSLLQTANVIAESQQVSSRDLVPDKGPVLDLQEAAQEREVVIVVADPLRLATDAGARQTVEQLSHLTLDNFAILMPWTAEAPGGVSRDAYLDGLVPGLTARLAAASGPHDALGISTANDLIQKLSHAVTLLRCAQMSKDEPRKAEDAQLSQAARDAGVPIDSRPTVAGPGQDAR